MAYFVLMKNPYYSDIDFLNGIKTQDEHLLKALYHQYFRMIRHYVLMNNGNESDAKDIYHETLMVLIHAVQKEDFILHSSLSTFIFAIGKRLWLKHLNKHKNTSSEGDLYDFALEHTEEQELHLYIEEHQQKEQYLQTMHQALQQLGNPCYELLKAFYFQHLSMDKIAEKMNYTSADVAKAQKYKCLQRLKKLFFKRLYATNTLVKNNDV